MRIKCKRCDYEGSGKIQLHCVTCPHCGKKIMKLPDTPTSNDASDKFVNMVVFFAWSLFSLAFEVNLIIRHGWEPRLLWIIPTFTFLVFWKVQSETTPNKAGRFLIKRDFPL